MKAKTALVLGVCLVFLVSGCQSRGAGPLTWIDQPLDNSEFPLGNVILQAHASDSEGVSSIAFYLEGQPLIEIDAGGGRLGEALYNWQPPGSGVYTIYARSTDANGNQGMPASSKITIIYEVNQVSPITLTQTPFELPPQDEEDEIQAADEEVPPAGPQVVSNRDINCRKYPDTSSEILGAQKNDQAAAVVGRLANNTWYLVALSQGQITCWVSAAIVTPSGDFSQVPVLQPQMPQSPPPEAPAPPEPEPPAPPQPPAPPEPETDTKPPAIASVSISPSTIYQQGCGGFTQTALLTLEVIDLGGVASVTAAWTGGSATLTHIGGYSYQAAIGPINTTGPVLIYGSAVDASGNWTPFSVTVTVDCCVC